MSLEREIQKATGVLIKGIPADGKSRTFKANNKEWFALSFGECGAFGCFYYKEIYAWDGALTRAVPVAEEQPFIGRRQLEKEREIVAMGSSMQDRGLSMATEHLDRYILALARVIESNDGQI